MAGRDESVVEVLTVGGIEVYPVASRSHSASIPPPSRHRRAERWVKKREYLSLGTSVLVASM